MKFTQLLVTTFYCCLILNFPSAILPTKADCSVTYSKQNGEIKAKSVELEKKGHSSCRFQIDAPEHYKIELNLTQISGFIVSNKTQNSCLPEVEIKDIMHGQEVLSKTVCWQKNNSYTPQVFLSNSNSLRIIYTWRTGHESSFHIFYHFFQKKNCEPGSSSGVDCTRQEHPPPTESSDFVKTIVIVVCTAIFIALGIIIFLVMRTQCKMVSRAWQRHSPREGQLRPQSQSSEVFVSTPSSREQMEQQEALLRDRYVQISSTQRDGELGYPPQIPISRDGEEGYAESQKQLANQRNLENTDLQQYFRPPPNRTIFDRKQSPPLYPYTSATSLDTSCGKPSNGYSSVIRCNSISINSAKSDSSHQSISHSRTSSISVPMSPARHLQRDSNSSPRLDSRASPPSASDIANPENVYNNNNKQLDV